LPLFKSGKLAGKVRQSFAGVLGHNHLALELADRVDDDPAQDARAHRPDADAGLADDFSRTRSSCLTERDGSVAGLFLAHSLSGVWGEGR
jgi:hypothetical protein